MDASPRTSAHRSAAGSTAASAHSWATGRARCGRARAAALLIGNRRSRETAASGKRTGSRSSSASRHDMRVAHALFLACASLAAHAVDAPVSVPDFEISSDAREFAPGIVSSNYSDVRLTIAPDGNTALWFSRNRPGGPGGYDIWMSRRSAGAWSPPEPVTFNTPSRDFDPAFSRDGRHVYFSSDRPGGRG